VKAAVRVNAEKLIFNWQLGRDLVQKKAEERWGAGVVEQVSLDMQNEFPESSNFSARNLWYMKQWYLFYTEKSGKLKQAVSEMLPQENYDKKLLQVGRSFSEEEKLKQVVSEFPLPFACVPWGHHVRIVQHSKTIEEALFYIGYTIEEGLSRDVLICSNLNKADVQWSFRGISTPMGVATYNNIRIADALPTQEQLKERMEMLRREMLETKRLIKKSNDSF